MNRFREPLTVETRYGVLGEWTREGNLKIFAMRRPVCLGLCEKETAALECCGAVQKRVWKTEVALRY